MQVDFLVIGQGISGSFLSFYLQKAGCSFMVIDQQDAHSPSSVAAGIINPVTGRRIVSTWMIDKILPFALQAYQELADSLQQTTITQKNIIDLFPTSQMLLAFEERIEQNASYIKKGNPETTFPSFSYDFGYGEIEPVYMVHLQHILPAWRQQLSLAGRLLNERFDISQLKTGNHIRYKHIEAEKIIFCDGLGSYYGNPFFQLLPFAPNKGEVLQVSIPGLADDHIYKKGMTLAPLGNDQFWLGTSYDWQFDDTQPTPAFYERARAYLQQWLKVPFTITAHLSALRPATLERRPFVGFHPIYKNVGILNGMGTKGCSLAPYFASQLVQHMMNETSIHPEADISRFSGILSRPVF